MITNKINLYKNKSLLENYWYLKQFEERFILANSQRYNISPLLSKLLISRGVENDSVINFLNPDIKNEIPNPFMIKGMKKSVERAILAIKNNQKIGIISDYDVDGSTSASILYKFLLNFTNKIILKIPNRLSEGYGPNLRIMNEMLEEEINLVFTLDCGTTSSNIIDNKKFLNIDVIVIDHHLGDNNTPNVFSIINPNLFDEKNDFNHLAAVGVTFLFLMALRKNLRKEGFFKNDIIEPNLLSLLDLVALGTVCDVVNLTGYNRLFVKMGLELIKKRLNLGISKIIDNSNLNSTPTSSDLGFLIGPQLNAASRMDDSSLPSKLLIGNDPHQAEIISKKLLLLNEKRKIIESKIYDDCLIQVEEQKQENFILVYGNNWHNGVLGIVASRLVNKFNKPAIVVSFVNSIGVGSARSINNIDLGRMILEAKNQNLLNAGGGHSMAAGLKINLSNLDKFKIFLNNNLKNLPTDIFKKVEIYDAEISIDEINNDFIEIIDTLEPFGSGNPEPRFIIKNLKIEKVVVLKNKHIMLFIQKNFSENLKAICFNAVGTILGDYLIKFNEHKLIVGCAIRKNNYKGSLTPQIIINDIMIPN